MQQNASGHTDIQRVNQLLTATADSCHRSHRNLHQLRTAALYCWPQAIPFIACDSTRLHAQNRGNSRSTSACLLTGGQYASWYCMTAGTDAICLRQDAIQVTASAA